MGVLMDPALPVLVLICHLIGCPCFLRAYSSVLGAIMPWRSVCVMCSCLEVVSWPRTSHHTLSPHACFSLMLGRQMESFLYLHGGTPVFPR